MTEKAKGSQLLDSGLSTKVCKLANPFTIRLKCDGDVRMDVSSLMPRFQEKFLGLII